MKNTPYSTRFANLSDLKNYINKEIGLSDWVDITQEKINTFGRITEDEQWIHIDSERSAKESPYKTTVAHGFMVLSFASKFCYDCMQFDNVAMGVNYGLNKVRFPSPTLCGGRVRGRVSVLDYKEIEGGARYTMGIIFELEGQEKPVCVAEFLAQAYSTP